jgi:hypothetical protein
MKIFDLKKKKNAGSLNTQPKKIKGVNTKKKKIDGAYSFALLMVLLTLTCLRTCYGVCYIH